MGLFFCYDIPILSTIPNLILIFLIYRMKCYFLNVWYYHTLKKQSKTVSISEILHILLMSMEIPASQSFSELLTSGNFVI